MGCVCVSDGASGWVTICGNQGTPFLEPDGNVYECVKDVQMETSHNATDGQLVRCIEKGEIVEILEFPEKFGKLDVKRVRARAKRDGVTGWITMVGEKKETYLKIAFNADA